MRVFQSETQRINVDYSGPAGGDPAQSVSEVEISRTSFVAYEAQVGDGSHFPLRRPTKTIDEGRDLEA